MIWFCNPEVKFLLAHFSGRRAAVHSRIDSSVTPTFDRLRLEERMQIRVDLFLMGRAQAVRRARIDFQRGGLDEL